MRLIAFAGSFVAGIGLASANAAPASALVLFLVAAIALGVLLHSSRLSVRLPLVLLLPLLVLGMLRGTSIGADSDALASFHGLTPRQVEGVVVSDPEPAGEFSRLRLRVDRVGRNGEWSAASGDILVTLREPVAKTIKTKHGGKRELRRLSPEEKASRRFRRNLIMMTAGILLLVGAMALLNLFGRQ